MTSSVAESGSTPVDFWFDPLCPWAWITSRWLVEVEKVRNIEIRWHVMSLAILNEDETDGQPDAHREMIAAKTWPPIRVVTAAWQLYGAGVLGPLYAALGTRVHDNGERPTPQTLACALADAGLPAELLAHAGRQDFEFEAVLRASHREGIEKAGRDVGIPVIALPGPDGEQIAFFGPVVSPAPKGEEAARLWDGTVLVASVPGFYEIKRTRTAGPLFD
ncbi:mycothiol-dependent nitroreductase Rv2466c family protein [Streptomyces sp. NPDC002519]